VTPEELEDIAEVLSDISLRADWPDEARWAVSRFNAGAVQERALLDAAWAACFASERVAPEVEVALRGAAVQYRHERERLLGRYDVHRPPLRVA
jgi:hypothetical protein